MIAAIGLALLAFFWPRAEPASAQPALEALRNDLATLRWLVTKLEASPVPLAGATSPKPTAADEVTVRQVHEWVWSLEQRLVQLEQAVAETRAGAGAPPPPAPDIAQSRQVAINPQAPVEDRLAALRSLRAANARSADVVQAMLKLQVTAADPNVRADVFRQLSGVTDPVMKPHLISGVLKDQDAKVREEAAETLAPFWSDPYVQAALRSAAQNDPDPKVRKQALETLERKGER
ncbi:MAG: HEAT repeat domain-containing protein [Verrucomicrobiota bacterium]|nr:HEAT repeat domain-containing protein [Verrucomicrobiota bacterium]